MDGVELVRAPVTAIYTNSSVISFMVVVTIFRPEKRSMYTAECMLSINSIDSKSQEDQVDRGLVSHDDGYVCLSIHQSNVSIPYSERGMVPCCAAVSGHDPTLVSEQRQSSGSSGMIEESSIEPATDVPYLVGDIKGKVS